MKLCPECGTEADNKRHYCPKCGAPLIDEPAYDTAPKRKKTAAILNRRTIIAAAAIIAVLALIVLLPHSNTHSSAKTLAEEYAALLKSGDTEKAEKLFAPEIIEHSSLDALDSWIGLYGSEFGTIGIYNATDTSGMDADSVKREIRNTLGVDLEISDYAQYLIGIVVGENDLWLQLDLIKLGKTWYICTVS